MSRYPHNTGHEVFISLHLSHKMLEGTGGRATFTKESVGVDYLKSLFSTHGVIVSCKNQELPIFRQLNKVYDLDLELPNEFTPIFLSEKYRRLVVVKPSGLPLKNGSLLSVYQDSELAEANFSFDKYYDQSVHYDDLTEKLAAGVKQAEAMKIRLELAIAKAKSLEGENALLRSFIDRSDN